MAYRNDTDLTVPWKKTPSKAQVISRLLRDRQAGDRGVFQPYGDNDGYSVQVVQDDDGRKRAIFDCPHNAEVDGQDLSEKQLRIVGWNANWFRDRQN